MDFGYFTLSDNHYAGNTRSAEAAGFDEVILYFNLGLKPHAQVKDEMARFMAEVAPSFANRRSQGATGGAAGSTK